MIILDIETTGLDEKVHAIIDIGAVDFENPENQFDSRAALYPGADPDIAIDDNALKYNQWTREQVLDPNLPSLPEVIEYFDLWASAIREHTIAGQNVANFDIPFLQQAYFLCGLEWTFGYRSIDQHSLVVGHMISRGLKVPLKKGVSALNGDAIMAYVGLSPEPFPHLGINGAKWEAEAMSRLLHGKNLLPEFDEYSIPEHLL